MENLYDTDYSLWVQQQHGLLKAGRFNELDLDNLIEEVEAMGKSEYDRLVSHLRVLLCHLLKWQYQPERRGRSWEVTIITQRNQAEMVLYDSPSFKHRLPDAIDKGYRRAVNEAIKQTGLPKKTFPVTCPWSYEQFMSDDFRP